MMEAAAITGVFAPAVALWIADQLPKKGDSVATAERKTKNLVVACLAGVGIAYIATQFVSVKTKNTTTSVKRVESVKGFTIA